MAREPSLVYFTFQQQEHNSSDSTTAITLSKKLREKFSSQQEGKLLWLARKENIDHLHYLPIEYSNDEEVIVRIITKIVCNGSILTNYSCGTFKSIEYLLTRIHPNLMSIGKERLTKAIDDGRKKKIADMIDCSAQDRAREIYRKVKENGGLANIDEELAIEYMKIKGKDGGVLDKLSVSLINDRNFVLKVVELCPCDIFYAPYEFQKDRETVVKALSNDAWILENLDDEFKDDEEIFEIVARTGLPALMFTSDRLSNDTEFVMKIFRKITQEDTNTIADLSEREVCMHMVKKHGFSLRYMNEEFRDDIEIVLCALDSNCHSIQYASDRLRSDHLFMKKAIEKYSVVYSYASDDLRNNDIELALISVKGGNWIPDEHNMNMEVVKAAVKRSALQFIRVPAELKSNASFILEIFNETTEPILKHVAPELRSSQEFILQAIKANNNNVLHLSSDEMNNKEFERMVAQLTGYTNTYNNELYEARMEYMFNGARV